MGRVSIAPDPEKLDVSMASQAIRHAHSDLRQRILNGVLEPGTTLSPTDLKHQLEISGQSLHEVLSMLHHEGLIVTEPDQRIRVTELDPQELDSLYASRILLETLAVSMTVSEFERPERQDVARQLLTRMRQASAEGDTESWSSTHRQYHSLLICGSGTAMQRRLRSLSEQSARYIRSHQVDDATWQAASDAEYQRILEALIAGRQRDVLVGIAHHLAGTALHLLSDLAPGYDPVAIRRAVGLVDRLPKS